MLYYVLLMFCKLGKLSLKKKSDIIREKWSQGSCRLLHLADGQRHVGCFKIDEKYFRDLKRKSPLAALSAISVCL